jgi:hypothetical protein
MDRRRFLQHVTDARAFEPPPALDIAGHTLVCEFELNSTKWKVYEDLRVRDGVVTFRHFESVGQL